MKLRAETAQPIVDKMMKQIPYNINMMDETGTIIASGDSTRIGSQHRGAVEAIKAGHSLTMTESYGEHGQPGVNSPVFFNEDIVGVIGITGDPVKVTPLASLLSTATELLLSQTQSDALQQKHDARINRFLHQWTQQKDDLSHNPALNIEAKKLKIDIQKNRCAIALHAAKLPNIPMDAEDFLLPLSTDTSIVLTLHESTITRLLTFAQQEKIAIGIGVLTEKIGISVDQALQVINIQEKMKDSSLVRFSQVRFISTLTASNLDVSDTVTHLQQASTNTNNDLLDSLEQYVLANGNLVHAAEKLHVHRNTLSYRLNKIKLDTKLDPRDFKDLFVLYAALLFIKMDK